MSLVVGECPEDGELIKALALAVRRPQRKRFTVLTWDVAVTKVFYLF